MKILLSCHPNTFGRFGTELALRMLPAVGIVNLELAIKTDGVPSPFGEIPILTEVSTANHVQRVAQLISSAGMEVTSCNITSGNPLSAAVVNITQKKMRIAQDFGATLVVAGGGEFTSAAEEQTLMRHLHELADSAQSLGMTYCCETHPGACQNAAAMHRTLAQVGHPALKINFDTANLLFYNQGLEVLDELRQVISQVAHVHLKDSRGLFQDWYFPALGEGGAINFEALRQILEPAGFCGPCSLELEGIRGEELTEDLLSQRLLSSVKHLRQCGYEF